CMNTWIVTREQKPWISRIKTRTSARVIDDEQVEQVRESWQQWLHQLAAEEETHLLLIESPYRSILRPILAYIDAVHLRHPEDTLTVILPEFVVAHCWDTCYTNRGPFVCRLPRCLDRGMA